MINEPGGGELDPEAMAALGEDMELGGEGGARAPLGLNCAHVFCKSTSAEA